MKLEGDKLREIIDLIEPIKDPEIGISIVKLKMVESIEKDGETLKVNIKLTVPGCPLSSTIEKDIKSALGEKGYGNVEVNFGFMTKDELEKIKNIVRDEKIEMPQSIERYEKKSIKKIIAVYSAKGGVGKSTVVKLLAQTAFSMGYKVGVLDCDISGPSIASLFGVKERAYADDAGKILPVVKDGIPLMTVDMLTDFEAIIWRGPLVSSAIKQMYNDTKWGNLDLLFLDLPPGTSDAPITVFQSIPVDGVVVITTPQELSNVIGKKSLVVAKTLNIPVIGLIKNMGYFVCAHCGEKNEINNMEASMDLPVLAELPFITDNNKDMKLDDKILADLQNAVEKIAK
jgi:ATP-binding protein involved in chromosome partitioning